MITAILVSILVSALGWLALSYQRLLRKEAAVLEELKTTLAGFRDKRVMITGGNSGVGFAAAVELAKANIPVTLACRNPSRAANARKKILEKVPAATVDILIVDVSDPLSVTQALEKMKTDGIKYHSVFCNAGIFPSNGFSWWEVIVAIMFRCSAAAFFETGRCPGSTSHCILQPHSVTKYNTELLFTTHVLGHYILVEGMLEARLLGKEARVVWTGSRAAAAQSMSWRGFADPSMLSPSLVRDLTAAEKAQEYSAISTLKDPYGASKFATDLASKGLDRRLLASVNGHSLVICPGFVDTHVAPALFRVFSPILKYCRSFLPSFQVTPERGGLTLCQALIVKDAPCDSDIKWVRQYGVLVPAVNGVFPLPEKSVELMMRVCEELRSSTLKFSSIEKQE